MQSRVSPDTQRASSSVVASMLQVGLVVIFATGMSAGVWVIFGAPAASPQAAFEFSFTDAQNDDELIVRHDAGNRIQGEQLYIVVSDATPDGATGRYLWSGSELAGEASVTADASVTLNATTIGDGSTLNLDHATVRVVWWLPDRNQSVVLARWSGPDATVNTAVGTPTPTVIGGAMGTPTPTPAPTSTPTPTPTATPTPTPTPTPAPTSADQVEKVSGSTGEVAGGKGLSFSITSNQDVTIERFSVNTQRDLSSITHVSRPGADTELQITNGGKYGRATASSNDGYSTDGTEYALNVTAEVHNGNTADIELRDFSSKITVNGFTDEQNADLTFTFVFADGSKKEFYFDAKT